MEVRKYDYLPEEAKKLRSEVFLDEQKFSVEFDDTDDIATHLVMFDGSEPAAVCRFFFSDEHGCYMIGRVAVAKEHRGKDLGSLIMQEAERLIKAEGGETIELSAQCRASGFYAKLGYKIVSEEYFDEYCTHVLMKKTI